VISAIVLSVAFKRIKECKAKYLMANDKMMKIHLWAYILTIVSLILFIGSSNNSRLVLSTPLTILAEVTNVIS